MKLLEFYSIVPEQLGQPDPLIVSHAIRGPYSNPPYKVVTTPSEVRLSEFLVREALMMADDLVERPDDPAALRHPVYVDGPDAPLNIALRERLSRCEIAQDRGDGQWHFYEGPGVFYIECQPGEDRSFYALLTAQTEQRLAEVLAWNGESDCARRTGDHRRGRNGLVGLGGHGPRTRGWPSERSSQRIGDRSTVAFWWWTTRAGFGTMNRC